MAQAQVEARAAGGSWTLRVYEGLPVAPAVAGLLLALGLALAFLAGALGLGGLGQTSPADIRILMVHILILAYCPTAYVLLIRVARRNAVALRPVLEGGGATLASELRQVGRYRRIGLLAAGCLGLSLYAWTTVATSPSLENPWAWSQLGYEVRWHRVLGPLMTWWVGCLTLATLSEAHRFGGFARRIGPVDLLDQQPLLPFTRQALAQALVLIGMVSVASLFLMESIYLALVASWWIWILALTALVVLMPLKPLRDRIRAEKRAEQAWCTRELLRARDALRRGEHPPGPGLAELASYRQLVEQVREWPFDNPALARIGIYLLIPLGSWAGAALVERLLDHFLG